MTKRKKKGVRHHIHWTVKQEIWRMPCSVCHERGESEIDHIIPISKGGTDERDNLQPLCRRCNGLKGNRLTNEQIRERLGIPV